MDSKETTPALNRISHAASFWLLVQGLYILGLSIVASFFQEVALNSVAYRTAFDVLTPHALSTVAAVSAILCLTSWATDDRSLGVFGLAMASSIQVLFAVSLLVASLTGGPGAAYAALLWSLPAILSSYHVLRGL